MAASRQRLAAELGAAMQAYQRSTQAFDDEVGRQLGLNPADLRCLDWLVDRARSPSELSEATGLSSAATTALIDRLERKGFVRRSRSDDRRRVLVEMTEQGRQRAGTSTARWSSRGRRSSTGSRPPSSHRWCATCGRSRR